MGHQGHMTWSLDVCCRTGHSGPDKFYVMSFDMLRYVSCHLICHEYVSCHLICHECVSCPLNRCFDLRHVSFLP
jgi:hypothetical protein